MCWSEVRVLSIGVRLFLFFKRTVVKLWRSSSWVTSGRNGFREDHDGYS